MDHEPAPFVLEKGMSVVGSDGEKVGDIDVVETNYVIVRKGLFPQDYYIPTTAIASSDGEGTVRLSIPAAEALERGLGNPTAAVSDAYGLEGSVTTTSLDEDALATTETDQALPDTTTDADVADTPPAESVAETAEPDVDITTPAGDEAHRTIALHEEELSATTRPVELGAVRVEKRVVEEQQTFEVPVVEEEVAVTRRRVDREITHPEHAFTEGHIEIPLRGQQVDIEKQAHVVEEIEIDKTAHQRIEQVEETVRHETAHIEGEDIEVERSGNTNDAPDFGDDEPR